MSDVRPAIVLDPSRVRAVIFDLDGVVTRTARVHAAAWKQLFDEYLEHRARRDGTTFVPFDVERDYREFVDGKPRIDGVRSFLASRQITIPEGQRVDEPGAETAHGLGARKNRAFLEMLRGHGVEVYPAAVALIHSLRERGIATAVVSSSRNCRAVLEAAGLEALFDVRVDGTDLDRLGRPGKPDPAMFLEAASQLGVSPEECVVVEDALAGVEAGHRGGFGSVIGVDRGVGAASLREHGADVVVTNLAQVALSQVAPHAPFETSTLPSAIAALDELVATARARRPAVFLDYDGTLSPIVSRPELAVMSAEMRDTVARLSERCPVAIVSGRDLRDVQGLVALDTVFYAGSHGFEIVGPEGSGLHQERGREFLPALDEVDRELTEAVASIQGAWVERKRFAVALHYRAVADADVPAVERAVAAVGGRAPHLRRTGGKKVFEFRPDIPWDKGEAVRELLGVVGKGADDLPIYVGDDVTDEDAFRAIVDTGIGVVVRDDARPTWARYALDSTAEVRGFLEALASALLERRSP